jgi:hypothetical protein
MGFRGKSLSLLGLAVALAVGTALPAAASSSGGVGWDIPSCVAGHVDGSLALLPVNDGVGYTGNGCLAGELATAAAQGQTAQLFVNGADPGTASPHWPADCAGQTTPACSTEYGELLAQDDLTRAAAVTSARTFWWIDVESGNSWYLPAANNVAALQGMIQTLSQSPLVSQVGIYSNHDQVNWPTITGSDTTGFSTVPLWLDSPGAPAATALSNCTAPGASFAGGPIVLSQYQRADGTDGDLVCPPTVTTLKPVAEGKALVLKGTGFPGSTVSVALAETDRTDAAASTLVDATGHWLLNYGRKARYGGHFTVTTLTLGGTVNAVPLSVTPVVTGKTVGGHCSIRTTGTMTPIWPGMSVGLTVKGRKTLSLKLTKNKAKTAVTWKQTFTVPCGKKFVVSIATTGRGGSKTYLQKLATRPQTVRT